MTTMTSNVTWTTSHTWVLKPIYVRSLCSVYDIILLNIDLHMAYLCAYVRPQSQQTLGMITAGFQPPRFLCHHILCCSQGMRRLLWQRGVGILMIRCQPSPPHQTHSWMVCRQDHPQCPGKRGQRHRLHLKDTWRDMAWPLAGCGGFLWNPGTSQSHCLTSFPPWKHCNVQCLHNNAQYIATCLDKTHVLYFKQFHQRLALSLQCRDDAELPIFVRGHAEPI